MGFQQRRTAVLSAVLVLVALASACAHLSGKPPPPVQSDAKLFENYLGFAQWNCDIRVPQAFVRVHFRGRDLAWVDEAGRLLFTPAFVEVIAHELAHIQQMKQYSCAEWTELSESHAFRQRIEREAHCQAQWITYKREC